MILLLNHNETAVKIFIFRSECLNVLAILTLCLSTILAQRARPPPDLKWEAWGPVGRRGRRLPEVRGLEAGGEKGGRRGGGASMPAASHFSRPIVKIAG